MKKVFISSGLVLAIVMSFFAVQTTVWAGTIDPTETVTVEGTVVSFHDPIGIVLEEATVDGVDVGSVTVGGIGPVWFWVEQEAIPEFDDYVKIEAYVVELSDDTSTFIACSITITIEEGSEVTITLRNDDGSPVWNNRPSATTTTLSAIAVDGICDGCPGCPGCDECEPNKYLHLEPGPHGNGPNSDE